MHLHRRSIRRFAHPYVKIFPFPGFEEEDVVAVVEFGQFIELVELCLSIELGIFPAVGKEGVEVIEQMSMSVGHPTRRED